MTRFGPLDVRGGTLVLGDDGGSHAALTPEAIILRPFEEAERRIEWAVIRSATVTLPQTRLRRPGLLTTVAIGTLAALLGDWGIGSDPREGELTLELRDGDGETVRTAVTCHHVGGYWVGSVRATSALLTRLVVSPESRGLLENPERVVAVLSGRE